MGDNPESSGKGPTNDGDRSAAGNGLIPLAQKPALAFLFPSYLASTRAAYRAVHKIIEIYDDGLGLRKFEACTGLTQESPRLLS